MGETKLKVSVLSLGNGHVTPAGPVECVVDTGATLSTLPGDTLAAARVARKGPIELTLADGRIIRRFYGHAILVLEDGNEIATRVIFGEPSDPALLGVVALETGGYVVDPIKGIVKRAYFHQY